MAMTGTANWVDQISVDRLSQRSNVYIRQTEDKTRIDQLIDAATGTSLSTAFKQTKGFHSVLEYNMLRRELHQISKDSAGRLSRIAIPIPMGQNVLTIIDEHLHHTSATSPDGQATGAQGALVIIHWVLTKSHADTIADWLAAWSQDSTLYKNTGTVFVFTVDENLFGEALRRLCSTSSIPTGSDAEIQGIFNTLCNKMKALKLKTNESFVQAARGLNLHQIETAALKGIFTSPNRQFALEPFTELKVQILESTGLTYLQPTIGWESIGSYNVLKTELQDFVVAPLRDPARTMHYGLGSPRGIILDGPPGVGKTLFSNACSKDLGLPMIKLTPADLYRSLVGESEGRVKKLTEMIESLAPVVVFIDEMDQLFQKREGVMSTDSGVNRRILNGLLEWLGMPGRRSFVIGATNRIEDMDTAATRPGRFDQIVYVPYPDTAGREEIFKVQCNVLNHIPVDPQLDYHDLAVQSPFVSGAEIEKWCRLAARAAMRADTPTVTQQHFIDVAPQIVVDVKQRSADMQAKIKMLKTLSNVNVPLLEESIRGLTAEIQDGGDRVDSFAGKLGQIGELKTMSA